MAPPLPAAGVVDVLEEHGKGSHPCGGQHYLRHSMLQAGVEMGRPEPGSSGAGQGIKEHKLRARVLVVAVPVPAKAASAPGLDPVGGAVDGAVETDRIDEGLQQK